jgi:hypothetical protein
MGLGPIKKSFKVQPESGKTGDLTNPNQITVVSTDKSMEKNFTKSLREFLINQILK